MSNNDHDDIIRFLHDEEANSTEPKNVFHTTEPSEFIDPIKPPHHHTIIDKILNQWFSIETGNKTHRESIIKYLKWLIAIELIILFIFIIVALYLKVSPVIIASIITGVFGQTIGLVFVVVKYLFNNKDDKYLQAISTIYKNNKKL